MKKKSSPHHSAAVARRAHSLILPGLLCGTLLCLPSCKPGNDEAAGGTPSGSSSEAKTSGGGGKAAANSAPSIPDVPPLDHPAKNAEAAKVLDLENFELMPGLEKQPGIRTMAQLIYRSKGDVKSGFEFQRAKLQALGWKELPGTNVTDQYSSGFFKRGGFHLSVSVNPMGDAGTVDVSVVNHGNVDLSKLPLPPNLTPVYVGPITAMYTTTEAVPATVETCDKLLKAAGWQTYGSAGDTKYYKQNAVLVQVTVSSAPAQGGKTMISANSQQLSADLPALPDAQDLRYTDSNGRLDYQSPAMRADVEKFYRTEMSALGWQATLDHAIEDKDHFFVIFRNPEKAMASLYMKNGREGGTGVRLEYVSPTQFIEMDRREAEYREKLKAKLAAEKNAPKPQVALKLPKAGSAVKKDNAGVQFNVSAGKAKESVNELRKQCAELGWTEQLAVLESMGGTVSLKKDALSLSISYTDSGLSQGEVSVMLIGAELTME
ncbi:MAG: hypothetical protein ACAH88_18860 [Roseimicrobium sp.]